jgi:hypothetical protein
MVTFSVQSLYSYEKIPTPSAHLIVDWLDAVDGWDA